MAFRSGSGHRESVVARPSPFRRRGSWLSKPTVVQHGNVTLLAQPKTHGRGEHLWPTLRLCKFVDPPISGLTWFIGELSTAAICPVDDWDALHCIAIVVWIGPRHTNSHHRLIVGQGKGLRQIVGITAVGIGGRIFGIPGAKHDRLAVSPIDLTGQRTPIDFAAGCDHHVWPTGWRLVRHTLALDAEIGRTVGLSERRGPDHG